MQAKSDSPWCNAQALNVETQQQEKKVWTVFWLTTVVMVIEIVAGTWSGSMALLADGWHMGTHSAAFAITLFTYLYAKKHRANQAFSFGTGKVNYLGGFASAIALAIVALMMIIESTQRLMTPETIHFNEAIGVAILGLLVNVASVFVLHDHHGHSHDHSHGHDHSNGHSHSHQNEHSHHGDANEHVHTHSHEDHNMKAAYFHVLADTLTSILAIFALLAGKYFGWIAMDALMGIVGAAVILRWAYGLIKESSEVLLDKSVSKSSIAAIANAIEQENSTTIHDIHVWKIATAHLAVILSVSAKNPLTSDEYKVILKQHLPQLSHISIEITQE